MPEAVWRSVHLLPAGERQTLHLFYLAIGGFQDFKTQPFIFNDLAGLKDAAGDRADQSSDGGGIAPVKAHVKEVLQPSHVHRALHDVSVVGFADNVLRKLMLVAYLTDDFFHQVLKRHQACNRSVFVNHNRHMNIVLLHFTQKLRGHFGLRHKKHRTHKPGHGSGSRLIFRKLNQIMRQDHSLDMIDVSGINRDARNVACHAAGR